MRRYAFSRPSPWSTRPIRAAGGPLDLDSDSLDVDDSLLREERHRAIIAGLAELAPHQRQLLELLVADPPNVLPGHQPADRDAGRQHRADQGTMPGQAQGDGADSGPTVDGELRQSRRWAAMTSTSWMDDDEELLAMIKTAVAGRDRVIDQPADADRSSHRNDGAGAEPGQHRSATRQSPACGRPRSPRIPGEPSTRISNG